MAHQYIQSKIILRIAQILSLFLNGCCDNCLTALLRHFRRDDVLQLQLGSYRRRIHGIIFCEMMYADKARRDLYTTTSARMSSVPNQTTPTHHNKENQHTRFIQTTGQIALRRVNGNTSSWRRRQKCIARRYAITIKPPAGNKAAAFGAERSA
jgi:hypothetical protein